jgi:hypothetical protein
MPKLILMLLAGLVFGAVATTTSSWCQAKSNPRDSGPLTLLFTYRCPPSARPKLRKRIRDAELKQLAAWKRAGRLAEFQVFFSRYADSDAPDVFLLLHFPSYLEVDRWKEVEATSPAALSPALLGELSSVNTYPLDRMREGGHLDHHQGAQYVIIPYDFEPNSIDEYLKYFDSYVVPQLAGWAQESVLLSYQLYVQRYTAGRPWGSLLILQYRDGPALGMREKVVAEIRQGLKQDPAWEAINQSKQQMRKEKTGIIADEVR